MPKLVRVEFFLFCFFAVDHLKLSPSYINSVNQPDKEQEIWPPLSERLDEVCG